MKFIHIADLHFDSPFVNLSDKEGLGELCRLQQRKVFKKVIEYIKENQIDTLFISGDLYEQEYIRKTTIEYINNLFKEISDTKIYIAPGNHDPYIKNSYYNKFKWSDNVKIFEGKIEKVNTPEADIYGFGFEDFYCKDSNISELEIENPNKLNILVMHGDIDASQAVENQYNPISKKELLSKGFDYIALGHIHKPNYENYIVYPGSAFPLGFDELGKRGMIVGEINKEESSKSNLTTKFVELNEIYFVEKEIDVTPILSKEELVEKINELPIQEKELAKVVLIGKRNFEIDVYDLYKLIENDKIIKIKEKTKMNYDLQKIANDTTLKGLYVKEMITKLEEEHDEEEKQIIEKAIEIGLDILEGTV